MLSQSSFLKQFYNFFRKHFCSVSGMPGVLILTFVFLYLPEAYAAQATLSWDDNNEPGLVAGYHAYCGTSIGNYQITQDVQNQTSCDFTNLEEGKVYYFAVKAYSNTGAESDYSAKLAYSVPISQTDTDGDGIIDYDETHTYGTDSNKADTDGDGIDDGQELALWGNNWNKDYDNDGLINLLDYDSDGDTFPDGIEVTNGSSPVDAGSYPGSSQDTKVSEDYALIPQPQLSILSVDSEETVGEDGAAENAIDGQISTFWHTEWYNADSPYPHEIVIDLGNIYEVGGFRYLPRQDGEINGTVAEYNFYVSDDSLNWGQSVATGKFSNDTTEKEVTFSVKTGRFVRFLALSEVNGNPWASMAEISILALSAGSNTNIDIDNDGIIDYDETNIYGTDPNNPDTDGDGINDGQELAYWGDNWNLDYDHDGLINLLDNDSDGDSYPDGDEVNSGTDPADQASTPVPADTGIIIIEAEDGFLTAPMQIGDDSAASSGKYIEVPAGFKKLDKPSADLGYALYTFDVPATGDYRIWGRVLTPDVGSDSFFVSIDDGDYTIWHIVDSDTWTWDVVSDRKVSAVRDYSNPLIFNLEKGEHTLIIKYRETESELDKILISNDPDYVPDDSDSYNNPQVDPAPGGDSTVMMEAEDGLIAFPMEIRQDNGVSAGEYIEVAVESGRIDNPYDQNAGYAEYTFNIPAAGDYRIWGRVLAPDPGSDSFYISIDHGDYTLWHIINSATWTWDVVSNRDVSDVRDYSSPLIFRLGQGKHILTVKQREAQTSLDKVIITNNSSLVPND